MWQKFLDFLKAIFSNIKITVAPSASVSKPYTPPIDGSTCMGLDVSHYKPGIDWAKVPSEIKFVFMKATEGLTYKDNTFLPYWQAAKAHGKIRGAYHFFRANVDGVDQAKHFMTTIGNLDAGDLPLVLDWETADSTSPSVAKQRAMDFLLLVEKETGKTPIIYSSNGHLNSLGDLSAFSRFPLWIASLTPTPKFPKYWNAWTFWQYSWNGQVNGCPANIDMNKFNGSASDLDKFIKS